MAVDDVVRTDEKRLAELGYKQEIIRGWSSLTNFAISVTIISVLAGTFTNFSLAWNQGRPRGIAIGWAGMSAFVLLAGCCVAAHTVAYATGGGPRRVART